MKEVADVSSSSPRSRPEARICIVVVEEICAAGDPRRLGGEGEVRQERKPQERVMKQVISVGNGRSVPLRNLGRPC